MPQLDQLTFFSQLFWLSLVLIFFYFFFSSKLLPSLARNLKARNKLLVLLSAGVSLSSSSKLVIPSFLENENLTEALEEVQNFVFLTNFLFVSEELDDFLEFIEEVLLDTNPFVFFKTK
jgi:hypothetical protein